MGKERAFRLLALVALSRLTGKKAASPSTSSFIDSTVGVQERETRGTLSLLMRPSDNIYRLLARSGRPNARGLDCFGLFRVGFFPRGSAPMQRRPS